MGKIFRSWPVFFLVFVEILLFTFNYTPGTYFLGWDNLFPEMNFPENFRRSFFGVWQEYRGLGLLDGMSFAANLPHYIFLSLLSLFLPLSLLRYFFIFFMHFLGGLGVYLLIMELTGSDTRNRLVSLIGALFYLLNIGTVQMFFAPYEVFAVHFAFLPLLILFLIKYLKSGSGRHLFYFTALLLLSTPQAHVPTLFVIFAIALFLFLLFHLIYTGKKGFIRVAIILAIIFSINSFWGLPYIYSAFNNAQIISSSKINQMASEDIYLKNKAYGDLGSVIFLKGFSLDFVDNPPGGAGYMMKAWRTHINQPAFIVTAFLLFVLVLTGIISSVRGRKKRLYPFMGMFLLSFLMLADDVFLIGGFSFLLRSYVPYFDQVFRFTFTKFAVLYAFTSAVFLGVGLSVLWHSGLFGRLHLLQFKPPQALMKFSSWGIFTLFLLIFAYYSYPAFQGNFLYRAQGLKIPGEYFQLVEFFKSQNKAARVALVPQTSLWGWTYTDWGYQGSGFLWYGIPQATLDGAFYPWSRQNENYYWELTQAFFQKDKKRFGSVLDKYQISWIVVDNSLKNPLSRDIDYNTQIQEVIEKSDKLKFTKSFGSLSVYQVNLSSKISQFVFLANNLSAVGPDYQWSSLDQGYLDNGNYLSTVAYSLQPVTFFYPFRSLFTARAQQDLEFKVEEKEGYFSFKSNIPQQLTGGKLVIPALSIYETERPVILFDGEQIDSDILGRSPAEVWLSGDKEGTLEVRLPKVKGFVEDIEPVKFNLTPGVCNLFNKGIYKYDQVEESGRKLLRMESIGSDNCLTLSVPGLAQKNGYLVTVESRHTQGKSLLFAVINQTSRRADLEVGLPRNKGLGMSYFIIPPMEDKGEGYTLYFDNISFGRVKTVNDLGKITVNPIPYQFLKSLKVVKDRLDPRPVDTFINIKTDHPNPGIYRVAIENPKKEAGETVLVLSQSFDRGWRAYQVEVKSPASPNADRGEQKSKVKSIVAAAFPFLFGRELKEHVLVNNWENGWVIDDPLLSSPNLQLVIVYLPQYLEYLGFGILGITFSLVFIKYLTGKGTTICTLKNPSLLLRTG